METIDLYNFEWTASEAKDASILSLHSLNPGHHWPFSSEGSAALSYSSNRLGS